MSEETIPKVADWVGSNNHVRRETIVVFLGLDKGSYHAGEDFANVEAALKTLFERNSHYVEGPTNKFRIAVEQNKAISFVNGDVVFRWRELYGRPIEKLLMSVAKARSESKYSLRLLFIEPDATYKVPVRAWLLTDGYVVGFDEDGALRDTVAAIERAKRVKAIEESKSGEVPEVEHVYVTASFNGTWNRDEEAYIAAKDFLSTAVFVNPYESSNDAMGVDVVPQNDATS